MGRRAFQIRSKECKRSRAAARMNRTRIKRGHRGEQVGPEYRKWWNGNV